VSEARTDEELIASLADDPASVLRELHRRHAALVFTVAARIVGRESAEDVVQDVFLTLWDKHGTFDPEKGAFRAWLTQIARRRALNEARRARVRRAEGDEALAEIADGAILPDRATWEAHRREVLRAALETLPEAQRRAVSLAYFDELTSEQIASVLRAPVGTAKTRIRLALRKLAPLLAAVAAIVLGFLAWRSPHEELARDERALRMVTASDVVPIRLGPTGSMPSGAHGNYRARAGVPIAVLTTSQLPTLASGEYVAWARHGETWTRLGVIDVEVDGRSLLVAERAALDHAPDEVRVTREASVGDVPQGEVVLHSP